MAYTEAEQTAWLASLPRKHMGAGVFLTDASLRVLLVEPTYQEDWLLPGGIVEAGESPQVGAFREAHEELGLLLPPGRLLVVDYSTPRPDGGDSLNWVFAGGPIDETDIVLQEEEIRSFAWCSPSDVERLTPPRVARRLAASLIAVAEGTTLYLEEGHHS
jgi:8-oxo-dGTP pyrophosphatase MutT (NUDIX family)